MGVNIAQLAWLNRGVDPVDVMSKALALRNNDSEIALRSQAMRNQQAVAQQNFALAQQEAARDAMRFLTEVALKNRDFQENARDKAFNRELATEELNLNRAKETEKSRLTAIQMQGTQELERLISMGVPYEKALAQTLPKIAAGNPGALQTGINRLETNAIMEANNILRGQNEKEKLQMAKELGDEKNKLKKLEIESRAARASGNDQKKLSHMLKEISKAVDDGLSYEDATARAENTWQAATTGKVPPAAEEESATALEIKETIKALKEEKLEQESEMARGDMRTGLLNRSSRKARVEEIQKEIDALTALLQQAGGKPQSSTTPTNSVPVLKFDLTTGDFK